MNLRREYVQYILPYHDPRRTALWLELQAREVANFLLPAFKFSGCGEGEWLSPTCHLMASAFAQVTATTAVHGEYRFFVKESKDPSDTYFTLHKVMHSWVEVVIAGRLFIIDIFPALESGLIFPALIAHSSAYGAVDDKGGDKLMHKAYKTLLSNPHFHTDVAILVEEMKTVLREVCMFDLE